MATSITFLSPLGALLALGALLPLVALLVTRRKATRVRCAVRLSDGAAPRLLVPLGALVAGAALLGLAATQPVLEETSIRHVRTDAEVFFVMDISRSMLAQDSPDSAMRIERAKAAAARLRADLPDVPVGIASVTDRVLPHLFPTADEDVFRATLELSLGIEQPPPRGSFATNATNLDALAAIRGQRFFRPAAEKKLVVVFTDGESTPVAGARLGNLYRRPPAVETIFVHVWGKDERVYTRAVPEPQYVPDPSSRRFLDGLASSTHGTVFPERSIGLVARQARRLLGSGPTVALGERQGREALAPYLAIVAFVPFGLLLWKRDR